MNKNVFRFSPINSEVQLMKAIEYTHFTCFDLCKRVFGKYLPISGNIGIFCHFQYEFDFLTQLREELTDKTVNWNQKYYLLHNPITIPAKDKIPETTYTFLYIRRVDPEKPQVGDADLVLEKDKFIELKNSCSENKTIHGVDLHYRPDLDMVKLSTKDTDVLPYITVKYMNENVKI